MWSGVEQEAGNSLGAGERRASPVVSPKPRHPGVEGEVKASQQGEIMEHQRRKVASAPGGTSWDLRGRCREPFYCHLVLVVVPLTKSFFSSEAA